MTNFCKMVKNGKSVAMESVQVEISAKIQLTFTFTTQCQVFSSTYQWVKTTTKMKENVKDGPRSSTPSLNRMVRFEE